MSGGGVDSPVRFEPQQYAVPLPASAQEWVSPATTWPARSPSCTHAWLESKLHRGGLPSLPVSDASQPESARTATREARQNITRHVTPGVKLRRVGSAE